MRTRPLSLLPIVVALILPSAMSAQAPQAARTIEIQASDTMKFTPARIDARPGERLHVVLKNIGTVPKAAMAHNFVLLKKGTDAKAFCEKSSSARDTNFIAASVKDQVLASTGLAGPGETVEVSFTAPAQNGEYTYVCTFPGHYTMGMKGTLVVSARDMGRRP